MLSSECEKRISKVIILSGGSPELRARITECIRYDWIKYGRAQAVLVKRTDTEDAVIKSYISEERFLEGIDFEGIAFEDLKAYAGRDIIRTGVYSPASRRPSDIPTTQYPILYRELASGIVDVSQMEASFTNPATAYLYVPWLRDILKALLRGESQDMGQREKTQLKEAGLGVAWLEDKLDELERMSHNDDWIPRRFPYFADDHDCQSWSDGGDYYTSMPRLRPEKDSYSNMMLIISGLYPELAYRTCVPDRKTLAAFLDVAEEDILSVQIKSDVLSIHHSGDPGIRAVLPVYGVSSSEKEATITLRGALNRAIRATVKDAVFSVPVVSHRWSSSSASSSSSSSGFFSLENYTKEQTEHRRKTAEVKKWFEETFDTQLENVTYAKDSNYLSLGFSSVQEKEAKLPVIQAYFASEEYLKVAPHIVFKEYSVFSPADRLIACIEQKMSGTPSVSALQ